MGDVTEKKEGLQMDRQGKSGEGVLPTGVVKAICISDVRGIEKRAIEEGHFLEDADGSFRSEERRVGKEC